MWYLFLQIWIWLIVAFALGWFSHWFFCCRGKKSEQDVTASGEQPGSQAQHANEPIVGNDEAMEVKSTGKD